MPAKASHIQQGIAIRKGRGGMQTAVCPHWGSLSIDDIYTDGAQRRAALCRHGVSCSATSSYVQPDAYTQVSVPRIDLDRVATGRRSSG